MEYENLIKERYSCRSFSSKQVEEEKLQKILEAGNVAPTARNSQCQKIYVLKSKEAIEKLSSLHNIFNAQVVLLVCGDKERECPRRFRKGSLMETDLAIVQTHMMLEAYNLGLGSCWVCYFDEEKVSKTFGVKENEIAYNLLLLGYPDENAEPSHRHFEKRELSDVVIEL